MVEETSRARTIRLTKLYQGMRAVDLKVLRHAFILDRDAGADPDFCNARIDALDAELARRGVDNRDIS